MPKLRNGDTPIAMLTHWLGRKCRNHNPLAELKLTASQRAATPQVYQAAAAKKNEVLLVSDDARNRLIYHNGEQAFEITVNAIPMSDLDGLELEPVAA